jgi:membrane protein
MEQVFSLDGLRRTGKALVQSAKDFVHDNGPQWAAAIAYYSLLSLFPLLLAAVAIAAYFVDPQWAIQQGSRLMGNFLPGSVNFIRGIIEDLIKSRGQVGIVSILLLIWSGSRVFGVITKALNIAYDASEPYGFLKRTVIELGMTVTIGILFLLALGSRMALSFLEGLFRIPILQQDVLYQFLGYAIPAALLLISLFLIYRYVPRRRVTRGAALAGSILFTVLFLVAQPLFIGYINTFANYNMVYGPLAIVITLVFWTWITANLLLLGGELASHLQDLVIEQKAEQEVEAHHKQRDPTSPEGKPG